MTQDEIMPLAIKAGFEPIDGTNFYAAYPEEIRHFTALVKSRFEDALRAAETALDSSGVGKKTREDALRVVRETLYDC